MPIGLPPQRYGLDGVTKLLSRPGPREGEFQTSMVAERRMEIKRSLELLGSSAGTLRSKVSVDPETVNKYQMKAISKHANCPSTVLNARGNQVHVTIATVSGRSKALN